MCLSLALVSCGDDDHKNDHHGMRTGIHKIVVEQSGNTEDFEVNLVFGATNVNGPARLYDENGDYLGDSYSVGKMKSNRVSCQTGQDGFFMTCSGSATSTSEESGKRLKVTIIAYVNGEETNRLVKEYIIRKSKFSPNPKRSVRFSSVHSKRNVQKRTCAQHKQ